MFVLASIRIALRALRVNKLRSALTMLGIVIGVGAVIAMVAIGSGAVPAHLGADLEHRVEPADRPAGQRDERRDADGPRLDDDPDRGGRAGHRHRDSRAW